MILKKINLTCFLLTFIIQLFSQNYIFKYTASKGGLWGFADITGKTIIEPTFMRCSDFSNCGVALVFYVNGNGCDLIKLNGQIIPIVPTDINFKHSTISTLNGLISVSNKNKWGFLNSQGQIAIPLKYDKTSDFNENFAIAEKKGNYFIIDTNGVEIPLNISKVKDFDIFSEGLARVYIGDTNFVFVNTQGGLEFSIKAFECSNFNSGLASAKSVEKIFGFVDKSGNWKIKPQFEKAHDFEIESGMALVKQNGKWVYIDTIGNVLKIDIDAEPDNFSNGLVRGFVLDNTEYKSTLVGFLNNKGEWVIKPIYDNARDFKNGFAAVKYNGKWGFIDKTGKWVVKPIYAHVGDIYKVD